MFIVHYNTPFIVSCGLHVPFSLAKICMAHTHRIGFFCEDFHRWEPGIFSLPSGFTTPYKPHMFFFEPTKMILIIRDFHGFPIFHICQTWTCVFFFRGFMIQISCVLGKCLRKGSIKIKAMDHSKESKGTTPNPLEIRPYLRYYLGDDGG